MDSIIIELQNSSMQPHTLFTSFPSYSDLPLDQSQNTTIPLPDIILISNHPLGFSILLLLQNTKRKDHTLLQVHVKEEPILTKGKTERNYNSCSDNNFGTPYT